MLKSQVKKLDEDVVNLAKQIGKVDDLALEQAVDKIEKETISLNKLVTNE